MAKQTNKKQTNNPVMSSALEAAKNHIDGFEDGTDTFNDIASKQLKEGDPRAINQVRENRRNIKQARKELGLETEASNPSSTKPPIC